MIEESNEELELDPSLIVEEEIPQEVEEPQQEAQAQEQEPEPDIPVKYQNKSAAEIIRMHQDAERLIGKQGNEVGELRKMVDDILHAQPSTPAPEEPEVDFFEDPKGATEKLAQQALANDPRIKAMEQTLVENRKLESSRQLETMHPDADELVQSAEFGEWLQRHPVRASRMQIAARNFDAAEAGDIIAQYKEVRDMRKETTDNAKANRSKAVKNASAGSGKASSETRGKPILSREALQNLKRNDPDRYYSMMPQIKQAYIEKRVR